MCSPKWLITYRHTKLSITNQIKIMTNETLNLKQYSVSSRVWTLRNELSGCQLWTSQWWCSDGDGVELYIGDNKAGFELNCFSGIPGSKIYIDSIDFGVLWNKAHINLDEVKKIQNYTYTQQCIMLADWLCSLFCEWVDVSDYRQL